jgi:hypothetical protein
MLSIRRSTLSLQRSSDPLRHFSHQSHSFAMLNPIQKTTITRFVHILVTVDRSYWEHNSDELATIDPMAIVQFARSTATQRASDYTTSEVDSTPEYPCDLGLGSLRPIAPKEVTANRWSTASRLVFSMGPLAMPNWDEEREVKVPHRRRAIADNVFRFDSGPQHDRLESARDRPSSYIPYPFLLLPKYSCAASLPRDEHKPRRGSDMGYEHGLRSRSWSNRRAESSYCRGNSFPPGEHSQHPHGGIPVTTSAPSESG